ncbi:hypothetical protein [Halegenticoccus soli]|uniref:hypothetical protein n=1 Tax=Halegenticoccus soli TaxID=1985678 RepID=UPI000C6E378F|nr:hypothetical protein [Halegenticoccus soli]
MHGELADEAGTPTGDALRSRIARWALLDGDRMEVSAALVAGIFGAFVSLAVAGLIGVSASRMMWFLNGTINGLLTLIPITIGINQIILSQELNPLGTFSDRFEQTVTFRERVEAVTDTTVSPSQASEFCSDLFAALRRQALSFGEACDAIDDTDLEDEACDYAETVADLAERMEVEMDRLDYDLLDTFLALLDYQDTEQFHRTRELRNAHAGALPDEATERLDRIEELFKDIDTIREYLKTLSVQRELAQLSRVLLYTGLPAIVVAGLTILAYKSAPGIALSDSALILFAGGAFALSLLPLAVLVAYMLRVATVARRTAAFGPFVSRDERRRIRRQNR